MNIIRGRKSKLLELILGILLISQYSETNASGTGYVSFNFKSKPTSLNESFSVSYSLLSRAKSKIKSPSGSLTLYSYTDSNCSVGMTQVGSPLDLSTSTTGTYSFSSPGSYYLKPSIVGYTPNQCLGPISLGTAAPAPIQRPGTITTTISALRTYQVSQTFPLSYSLFTSSRSKIKIPSGTVTLYSYTDSSCSVGATQVGSPLDLSTSTTGTYSFSFPGSYYIKPSIVGYTSSQCIGPMTVNSAGVPFEVLGLSSSIVNNKRTLSLRWEDLSGALSTSTSKSTIRVYSNSSCSGAVTSGIRPFSLSPKNGLASVIISSSASSLYAKATSGLISSGCVAVASSTPTCSADEHLTASNTCENNTRSCSLDNGTGTQTWTGSSFGSCVLSSCYDTNYEAIDGVCSPISCTPQNSGFANAFSVEGNLVDGCVLMSCLPGYLNSGSSCDEIQLCSTDSVAGSTSVSFNETFFSCEATSCEQGYHLEIHYPSGDPAPAYCESNTRSCSVLNGSGTQSWEPSNFMFSDVCAVSSCNPGYEIDSGSNSCIPQGVFSQISAGNFYTCAVTSSGGLKCWGWNNIGQLGDGTTTSSLIPVDVTGLTSGVVSVSAGDYHTCAVTSSGGVKCWGDNSSGQLGNGTTTSSLIPVDATGLTSGISSVYVGSAHTCALTTSGGVKCWGDDVYGRLGNGAAAGSSIPADVYGLTAGVTSVSVGSLHTCVVTSSGGVRCWGGNSYGQLGNNSDIDSQAPANASGLVEGMSSVSAGSVHTCALTTTGRAKCWGSNYRGQLGDGTSTNSPIFVDVQF